MTMHYLGNYALGIPSSQLVWLCTRAVWLYIDRAPVTSPPERGRGAPGAVTIPVSLFILRGERNLFIITKHRQNATDSYICHLMAFLFPLSYISFQR